MTQPGEIVGRIKWALLLRVILVTFLIGATFLVQVSDLSDTASLLTGPLVSLYILAGATYIFTILSGVLFALWKKLRSPLAYAQVFWEALFVTGLIYITGGQNSLFTFLYLLSIVTSAILLYRAGAFVSASLSSLFYGSLMFLTFYEKIPVFFLNKSPEVKVGLEKIIYNVSINTAGFFAVAILASYLAEQLRRAGEELEQKTTDLTELEALNDIIVQSIDAGIITTDNLGVVTSINHAATDITGLSEEEIIGTVLETSLPGIFSCEGGSQTYFENPARGKLFLSIGKSVLRGSHKSDIGELIVLNDLSEMRVMEEKLKVADRLAAVGELAAGLAHEIRNPLASISGSVQLLGKDSDLTDNEAGLMRIVLREAKRLNELITRFLNYARPSTSSAEEFSLNELVSSVVTTFINSPELPENLKVENEINKDITLMSDRHLVEQIMWNLLVNASQAINKEKGGTIRIVAESIENDHIRLAISDTGVGIDPEYMGKIFTPFFTTKEGGTGLGLATVYRVVEALGGHISVASNPGKGTTFTIVIPCCIPQTLDEETPLSGRRAVG